MLLLMFTGWSGAGKSTLANALAARLQQAALPVFVIDGDHYRNTINKALGFSEADRRENIRRLLQLAIEKREQGIITIVAAINPYEDQRQQIKKDTGASIIYIECPVQTLVQGETKGLYQRALLPHNHPQKINNLTGINDRYDVPGNADLQINTAACTVQQATELLFNFVMDQLALGGQHPVAGKPA